MSLIVTWEDKMSRDITKECYVVVIVNFLGMQNISYILP